MYYHYQTRNYVKVPTVTYNTLDVLTATVKAYHTNGDQIVKYDITETDPTTGKSFIAKKTNKELATATLTLGVPGDTTEAQELRDTLLGGVTLAILTNKKVNEFTQKLAEVIQQETVTSKDVGLLVYFPSTAMSYKKKNDLQEKLFDFTGSEYLGTEKDKVELNLTSIAARSVPQLNCFSVVGHTAEGNLVEFLTSDEELYAKFTVGSTVRIKGKVKKTALNPYYNNIKTTYLNYVKLA